MFPILVSQMSEDYDSESLESKKTLGPAEGEHYCT